MSFRCSAWCWTPGCICAGALEKEAGRIWGLLSLVPTSLLSTGWSHRRVPPRHSDSGNISLPALVCPEPPQNTAAQRWLGRPITSPASFLFPEEGKSSTTAPTSSCCKPPVFFQEQLPPAASRCPYPWAAKALSSPSSDRFLPVLVGMGAGPECHC